MTGPGLYVKADMARGKVQPPPFAVGPRTEREWAYVLLLLDAVEWVEIDAPGEPATVVVTVRLLPSATLGLLDEIRKLIDRYRPACQLWDVRVFEPGVRR